MSTTLILLGWLLTSGQAQKSRNLFGNLFLVAVGLDEGTLDERLFVIMNQIFDSTNSMSLVDGKGDKFVKWF